MDKKQAIVTVGIAIIVGAAGFFGGMKYSQAKTPARAAGQNFMGGQGFRNGGRMGGQNGGFTAGEIISKDDKSITVKLANNAGSKIIFYASSTEISKPAIVDASQLNQGENVVVTGQANSDGSITAKTIQVRPAAMPSTTK